MVVTNLGAAKTAPAAGPGTLSVTGALPSPRPLVVSDVSPRGRFSSAAESRRASFRAHVAAASSQHRLPQRLIESVIAVESDFNPQAVSRKGAQGLMQLMPDTAHDLGVANSFDPAANIEGGSRYLRRMLDEFHQDLSLALAAYNAGPSAVRAAGGVPRIPETIDYVRKVRSLLGHSSLTQGTSSLRTIQLAGGTRFVTNLDSTPSSLRVARDSRGSAVLTNR